MSMTRLIAVLSVVLFLRWLAVGQVTLTVAGATAVVPALAIAAAAVLAMTAAAVALVVYRVRAERAMLAAWQARTAADR
jgi:hypothetical protein